jgi:hypothetical protein
MLNSIFLVALLIFLFWLSWFVFLKIPGTMRQMAGAAKKNARRIARLSWYVKDTTPFENACLLHMFSQERERKEIALFFNSDHPSSEVIGGLTHLDIVKFDFQEEPLECAVPMERCAYLQVRKVGHFA